MDIKSIGEGAFWTDFYNRTRKNNIPFEAQFELTYHCNLSCCHCYIAADSKKKELTAKEIYSILDQLAEAGCFAVAFTGGEPLTRPDIFDILTYSKNKGFYVTLLTNGTLITPGSADYLHDIGIDRVDISFYGVTTETFENITCVTGSFNRCLQGIKLLQNRNIHIVLKMIVMTLNLKEFESVKGFTRKRGISFRYGHILKPNFNGSSSPLIYRISPKEAINLDMKNQSFAFHEEERVQRENKPPSAEDSFFYCNAGRNFFAITPYGELNLCLDYHFPEYDLRKGSFAEGWKVLVNYVTSATPNRNYKCNDCEYWSHCYWCPAQGLAEMGDLNACIPYFKELAKLRAKKLATVK